MVFNVTGFYLFSGLPGDRNRFQAVERCYHQVGLPNTPPNGDLRRDPYREPLSKVSAHLL